MDSIASRCTIRSSFFTFCQNLFCQFNRDCIRIQDLLLFHIIQNRAAGADNITQSRYPLKIFPKLCHTLPVERITSFPASNARFTASSVCSDIRFSEFNKVPSISKSNQLVFTHIHVCLSVFIFRSVSFRYCYSLSFIFVLCLFFSYCFNLFRNLFFGSLSIHAPNGKQYKTATESYDGIPSVHSLYKIPYPGKVSATYTAILFRL